MNKNASSYEEAVAYLNDMPRFTVKKDNRDFRWFLKKLGNPEQDLRIIHVAGTNGKGSVCAYMSSILQEAGYRTAVFTSPHLVDMRERFTVNGKMISEEAFLQVYRAVGDELQEGEEPPEFVLNFYEYLFCMALLCFAEEKPDYCIIETGLGGRLDATNYVDNKLLTVITRISLDHVQYLGDTTAKIAAEKAGILRPGVPVVYLDGDADASAVICRKASELDAPQIPVSKKDYTFLGFRKKYIDFSLRSEYYNYISLTLHTIARYQMENAALAVRAVEVLFRSTDTEENGGRLCAGAGCPTVEEIRRGILGCFWQGRMEEVLPEVYVDGAHNDDGIRAFLDTVTEDGHATGRRLLFGVAADKDCRHMIQRVITSGLFDHIAFTHMRTARSLSLEEFRDLLAAYPGHYTMYTEADTALREQLREQRPGERLYIAGSLYLVGEIKESLDYDQF
ncbi:bifunctional folylpolyglutamate synthase/dihydrofolate synthase [Simiaoa sp.]|uniref:bifunctional folylpolyglutamate synthase/dihydrofolate synthase n=1 Tax=Simiaoa sp. TaxID=2944202 RepID=UPI003F7CDFF9